MYQFVVQMKTVSFLNFLLQFLYNLKCKIFRVISLVCKNTFRNAMFFLTAYIYDAVSGIEFRTRHVYFRYRNLLSMRVINSYSTKMSKTSKVCRILYHVYHTICLTSIYITFLPELILVRSPVYYGIHYLYFVHDAYDSF